MDTVAISKIHRKKIGALKEEFDKLKVGKESLLDLLYEAELPEAVYNSNAIENSTLTIKETEQILMELEVAREVSLREVFEAKNLATVSEYVRSHVHDRKLNKELILFLHKILLSNISDEIAGRFRNKGEFVRVGTHIAPAPERVHNMLAGAFSEYNSAYADFFLEKISKFHLEFEKIHPLIDGNGRIGRIIINYQLLELGYPPIIIRDKEKREYYRGFKQYQAGDETERAQKQMQNVFAKALLESMHKRIAYLRGKKIILLSKYAEKTGENKSGLLNKAKRQTIAAFRERGVWKIGV